MMKKSRLYFTRPINATYLSFDHYIILRTSALIPMLCFNIHQYSIFTSLFISLSINFCSSGLSFDRFANVRAHTVRCYVESSARLSPTELLVQFVRATGKHSQIMLRTPFAGTITNSDVESTSLLFRVVSRIEISRKLELTI